jgi:hypothetical protein
LAVTATGKVIAELYAPGTATDTKAEQDDGTLAAGSTDNTNLASPLLKGPAAGANPNKSLEHAFEDDALTWPVYPSEEESPMVVRSRVNCCGVPSERSNVNEDGVAFTIV